ncbi:hypothetical protein [Pseudoclavibacter helvolus]|uniref:hypothetical protein n=1 Tax=Pseudoclavibacter helvolus TaxID=255205 RepID=UPI003C793B32
MTDARLHGPIDRGYRQLRLTAGTLSIPLRARSLVVGALTATAILLLGVVALGLGSYPLSPGEVVRILLGGGDALDRTVVFE